MFSGLVKNEINASGSFAKASFVGANTVSSPMLNASTSPATLSSDKSVLSSGSNETRDGMFCVGVLSGARIRSDGGVVISSNMALRVEGKSTASITCTTPVTVTSC